MPMKLGLATNMNELNKLIEQNVDWEKLHKGSPKIRKKYINSLLDKAREYMLKEDEEHAYIFLMRAITLFMDFRKTVEFDQVEKTLIQTAMTNSEKLSVSLNRRYEELAHSRLAHQLANLAVPDSVPDSVADSVPDPVPDSEPKSSASASQLADAADGPCRSKETGPEPTADRQHFSFISALQLKTLAANSPAESAGKRNGILLVDCRHRGRFSQSHIKTGPGSVHLVLPNCHLLNVPADQLRLGLAASAISRLLQGADRELWNNRALYEHFVIFDDDYPEDASTQQENDVSLLPEPLQALLKAVLFFDQQPKSTSTTTQQRRWILCGGYYEWASKWPTLCSAPVQRRESAASSGRVDVEYDLASLDAISKSSSRSQREPPAANRPSVPDRSTKPPAGQPTRSPAQPSTAGSDDQQLDADSTAVNSPSSDDDSSARFLAKWESFQNNRTYAEIARQNRKLQEQFAANKKEKTNKKDTASPTEQDGQSDTDVTIVAKPKLQPKAPTPVSSPTVQPRPKVDRSLKPTPASTASVPTTDKRPEVSVPARPPKRATLSHDSPSTVKPTKPVLPSSDESAKPNDAAQLNEDSSAANVENSSDSGPTEETPTTVENSSADSLIGNASSTAASDTTSTNDAGQQRRSRVDDFHEKRDKKRSGESRPWSNRLRARRAESIPDMSRLGVDDVGAKPAAGKPAGQRAAVGRPSGAGGLPHIDRSVKPRYQKPEPPHSPVRVNQRELEAKKREFDRFCTKKRHVQGIYGHLGRCVTGLKNLGNTCYMNSTVQALSHCVPLANFLLTKSHRSHVNVMNPLGSSGKVIEEFAQLVHHLWSQQYRSLAPKEFRSLIGAMNSMFRHGDQQDSHEFLSYLVDTLHEDINQARRQPLKQLTDAEIDDMKIEQYAKVSWQNYRLNNDSKISQLFTGLYVSVVTCQTCGYKSKKFDPFMSCSLEMPASSRGPVTLDSLMSCFHKAEKLTGDAQWKCSRCKVLRDATKMLAFWALPEVLVFTLKRFETFVQSGSAWSAKINNEVDFPLVLNMAPHLFDPRFSQVEPYELFAVTNHFGSLECGHYTACCRNPEPPYRWYKFNDDLVGEIVPNQLSSREARQAAYTLFYIRRKLPVGM